MKNNLTGIFLILFAAAISALTIFSSNKSINASIKNFPDKAVHTSQADSSFNWETMTFDQRKEYMKNVVMPTMKAEFVAFDSTRFTAMNCRTCHGSGVKDGTFKMPNYRIPMLHMDFAQMFKDNPHYMNFMVTVVKPKMAQLLNIEEYNPEKGTGKFGCQSCHNFEQAEK